MITTIAINGLTIGTYTSGYLFDTLNGFGSPDVKVSIKEKGAYHGADLGNYNYGKRGFSLEGRIVGDDTTDYAEKRRALEQAVDLYDGLQTVTIVTKDGLTLVVDVIITSAIDMPYEAGQAIMSNYRLEFAAPYPFIKGNADITETVPVHTGGGAEIPAELPLEIGQGGTGDTTVTNDGNAKAFPIIKIYGAIENPSISNQTRGESLGLTYTLNSTTDYIEIDTYNRTILLNGITNIRQYFTGDFIVLNPGDNTIRLSAASYAGGYAEIIYRDSYLGI